MIYDAESKEELEDYVDKNSLNNFVYIKFSYKEIGRSEKWFKQQCKDLVNNKEKINREILLQWNKATDKSPFTAEDLEKLREQEVPIIATVPLRQYYLLNVYYQFDWNKKLLIGGDFGGSSTKDATCFSIVDPVTLKILADFNNNKADPVEIADIVYELMTKFFPNAIFIPEQNGYSDACIAILLKTNVANRIYYEYRSQKHEQKMKDGTIKQETVKTKVYGVNTNTKTRDLMINLLFDIVANHPQEVTSGLVINDICGLERNKSGKIEAISPNHDDNLFSYLMTRYVMAYGNNLARFRIYKPTNNEVEDNANKGVRSDEEFVHNFSSIIQANFNGSRNYNQSDMQTEIIEMERQRKIREAEEREYDKIENGLKGYSKDAFSKIFSYNSMSNIQNSRRNSYTGLF